VPTAKASSAAQVFANEIAFFPGGSREPETRILASSSSRLVPGLLQHRGQRPAQRAPM